MNSAPAAMPPPPSYFFFGDATAILAAEGSGSGATPEAEQWKVNVIFYTSQCLSSLSLVMCVLVVATLFLFPALRSGHNRLVVNLCIANGLGAFSQLNVFEMVSNQAWAPDLCRGEAIGNQFFFMSSFFWTACLAWHVYRTITSGKGPTRERWTSFVGFHVISWGCPLASVIVLLVYDQFDSTFAPDTPGGAGQLAWCWVRPGVLPGQVIFYATLLAIMFFNTFMTVLTIAHVLRKYPKANRSATISWCGKVSAYVVVFVVVRFSSLLNRGSQIVEFMAGDWEEPEELGKTTTGWFILYLCHTIGSSSQGAFLAAVFCWNESILPLYRTHCVARYACCAGERARRRQSEYEQHTQGTHAYYAASS